MEGFGPAADVNFSHRPKTCDEIKAGILDPEGTFKYIQIKVEDTKTNTTKTVIRGCNLGYHSDILNRFQHEEMCDYPDGDSIKSSCRARSKLSCKQQAVREVIWRWQSHITHDPENPLKTLKITKYTSMDTLKASAKLIIKSLRICLNKSIRDMNSLGLTKDIDL